MSRYSSDFVRTVALIAAKAAHITDDLSPADAVDFAWFSVNCDGDAAEDDDDFVRHYVEWSAERFGLTA